jgi:hypothetical protein
MLNKIACIVALIPSLASATTYNCTAKDGTVGQFRFENRAPVQATLTYLGISFNEQQMSSLVEDWDEVPGTSVYVEASVQDYGTNGILFNAKYLPGSTTNMTGTLAIFGNWPMKSVPLTCTSSN